jgi:branched-chain amino acid transport system substrate-binding protein
MKSVATAFAAGLAVAAIGGAAHAQQISDDVVKIGVLTDMSSL